MSYQQDQAGWEWAHEDEMRWQAEQELAATRQVVDQSVTDRMLADFDSMFMPATSKESIQ